MSAVAVGDLLQTGAGALGSTDDSQDNGGETKLIDQLLEGWGKWAQRGNVHLGIVPVGFLWRIPSVLEIGHELVLSDDRFTLVDRHVARAPRRLRDIIIVEYMSSGPGSYKAQKIGLARLVYRQRLLAAQWTMYASLAQEMDAWMS